MEERFARPAVRTAGKTHRIDFDGPPEMRDGSEEIAAVAQERAAEEMTVRLRGIARHERLGDCGAARIVPVIRTRAVYQEPLPFGRMLGSTPGLLEQLPGRKRERQGRTGGVVGGHREGRVLP